MSFTNKGKNGSPIKMKAVIDDLKKQGFDYKETGAASVKQFKKAGCYYVEGFQLRYIYLIDKSCKITVPILPFSKIDELGAGMYKGKKISLAERKALSEGVESNADSRLDAERVTTTLPSHDGDANIQTNIGKTSE